VFAADGVRHTGLIGFSGSYPPTCCTPNRRSSQGVSFLCDPHYVSYLNLRVHPTRSVRRTRGLVLVGNSEIITDWGLADP
jgi:hypothetical protein